MLRKRQENSKINTKEEVILQGPMKIDLGVVWAHIALHVVSVRSSSEKRNETINSFIVSLKFTQEPVCLDTEFLSVGITMLRETTMCSAEHLKQLVRDKLEAAAEEIFAVFHRVIVDYEEELDRHRKFFEAAYNPVVKLQRAELPQEVVIKEEEIVEDQELLNQDKNSSQDQEEPEPLKLEEQEQEESSLELELKQEAEELQLCPAEVECNKKEDQSVDWHSDESDIKVVVITSEGSANSDLQQCSLCPVIPPTGAQKEGDQESESESLPPGKNQCVSTTGIENPGLGSSSSETSSQHEVMRKKYVCQECGKKFSLKSHLKSHQRTHTGEKPYVCDTCGKKFSGLAPLKSHKMIHTGERPYACDTCDMRFMKPDALKIHTRIHTGERPYVCYACGMRFMRAEALNRHRTVHSAKNPYVCQKCGKRFLLESTLTRHERTHSDEKPHVCDKCDKSFSKLEYLNIHARVHTGEKPYVCKTCDKRFSELESLKTHSASHTGEKLYVCSKCGSGFASTAAIHNHVRTSPCFPKAT